LPAPSQDLVELGCIVKYIVAQCALNGAYADAFIRLAAVALILAEVGADAACNEGHGIDLHYYAGSLVPVTGAELSKVGGNIRSCGAFLSAGGSVGLDSAEDGVIPVVAGNREALLTVLAYAVKAVILLAEVPAAVKLDILPPIVPILRILGVQLPWLPGKAA
jgi:hypothetical protein